MQSYSTEHTKQGLVTRLRRRPYRSAVVVLGIVIVLSVVIGVVFGGEEDSRRIVETVHRQDLVQEVSVTGRVRAAQDIDLAFERSGRVVSVPVAVGQKVPVGTALVWLNAAELVAQREEADAERAAQQAELAALQAGAQEEELRVQEAKLREAEQKLTNFYTGSPDVLLSAFIKADDAVRNRTDDLFDNDTTASPDLTFNTSDFQIKVSAENARAEVTRHLVMLEDLSLLSSSTSGNEVQQALKSAQERLLEIRDFLTISLTAVDRATSISASTISSYKDDLNTARTNVSSALSSVGTQLQNIAAQKLAVERAAQERTLLEVGGSEQEVAAQQARVRRAEAQLAQANAELAKAVVRAPFAGTVTTIAIDVGERVSPDTPAVTLISEESLEVEAFIPEVDVAEVSVEDSATITLDSFGSDVIFTADVISVDPAETVRDGVATYKTILYINEQDERIRPGMTANIDIITAQRSHALAVPFRAIIRTNGRVFVRVIKQDGSMEERDIKTGIRTIGGQIEVVEGLVEGEEVLVLER